MYRKNTCSTARLTLLAAVAIVAAGCASQGTNSSATTAAQTPNYGSIQKVKSRDGSVDGELVGTVVPGGKFSKLQIGMKMPEVLRLVGGPDGMDSHETGKRWIPFYFGGDARRIQAYYKGEGCLTYTGGNAWGGG